MDDGLDLLVTQAAREGDVTALSELVATHGASAVRMDRNPDELTALHWAAASGSREAVEYLLSPSVLADPRVARDNGFTPLHSAAMQGHDVVCEVLLKAGANADAQTEPQKYAPLHSAAFGGHDDAIRVLLAAGASRDLLNYRGERPADTAQRQQQTAAAALLGGERRSWLARLVSRLSRRS
jgi:ankyrin repeat protein